MGFVIGEAESATAGSANTLSAGKDMEMSDEEFVLVNWILADSRNCSRLELSEIWHVIWMKVDSFPLRF